MYRPDLDEARRFPRVSRHLGIGSYDENQLRQGPRGFFRNSVSIQSDDLTLSFFALL